MNHADPTGLETGQVAYDSISQMPTHGSAVDFHNFGQGFAEGLDTILRSGGSLPSSNSDAQLFGQAIGSIAGSLAIMCQGGICGNGSNYSPVPAMGRASVPEVAEPVIAAPYARPNNATTPAQRASVQGQPCVDCGAVGGTQRADHKTPLAVEYYSTGQIDKQKMKSLDAVQPQCATCSNKQGAALKVYSDQQRKKHGL